MKETSDTVLVLGRIFELEDPALRSALHRLMYELHDAQQRAATLGAQSGKRKLLRLAGLQRAAIEATFFDDDDRALDGMSLAARRYLARRTRVRSESAVKRRERVAAATVAALRNASAGFEMMKGDRRVRTWSPPSRWQVAEWLAWQIRGTYFEADAAAVYARMGAGKDGEELDASGVLRDEPFASEVEPAVASAFKALGHPARAVDALFRRKKRLRA